MVRKLFKHEFLAWLRVTPIVYVILLVSAVMTRIFGYSDGEDNVLLGLLYGLSDFTMSVGIMACMLTPPIFGIVRFYKNCFTGEGYLTFTLPVTQDDHIWVKALTFVCFQMLSLVVVLISSAIMMLPGEMEIISQNMYFAIETIATNVPLFLIEILVLILTGSFAGYLFFCTCLCIGQLFNRHRILAAVGVFFGFQMLSNLLSGILSALLVTAEETSVLADISQFFADFPPAATHIILIGSIVYSLILSTVYFLICRYILTRKLNLE
jgi:hypothetical protein